jgi:elongator complex protein 1
MASHTLSLNTPEGSTPVHVALSSERDVLAVLYETGHISLWELRTRLGPGSGKVVDPNLVWEGEIPNTSGRASTSWRQITIKASGDDWKIAILGSASDGEIVKSIIIPPREDYNEQEFILPSRNGRLVAGSENDTVWWEGSSGEINAGSYTLFHNSSMF